MEAYFDLVNEKPINDDDLRLSKVDLEQIFDDSILEMRQAAQLYKKLDYSVTRSNIRKT